MAETIRNKLLGCFEIALFMKSGINHFNDDFREFLKSFVLVFISFSISLYSFQFLYAAKEELQDSPYFLAICLFAIKTLLGLLLSFAFVYYVCRIVHRKHNFIKFITTSNWCSLINILFFAPLLILMQSGQSSYDDVYPMLVAISLYGYALAVFLTRYIIDVPWELAVFLTVCGIAINEASFRLFYYLAG